MRLPGIIAGLALMVAIGSCGIAAAELVRITDDFHVAGQPSEEEIVRFGARGGGHVIDLRPAAEARGYDEPAAVTRAGMAYYNIPVSGPAGLTRENVELLDGLLARLEGEKVLLHCSSSNRVGALMALRARWLHGASVDEALAVGERHGMTSLAPHVERLLVR